MNNIQLAHGSGGQAMQQLINSLFMEAFANPWLAEQEDQARLELAQLVAEGDRLAFSTDSYVIDPLFFPGGNIGKLAICGTANDVAVSGAIPRLSLLWLYPRRRIADGDTESRSDQHGRNRPHGRHCHRYWRY